MAYAIELYFNPSLETRLRRTCNVIRAELDGVVTVIDDVKARPNMPLAVMETAGVIELSEALRDLAARVGALPVALAAVGLSGSDVPSAYLTPAPTPELLQWHADLWQTLARFTESALPEYAPGRWVPRCTMATSMPPTHIGRVAAMLLENTFPMSGELVELGLTELAPVRPVMSAMLV